MLTWHSVLLHLHIFKYLTFDFLNNKHFNQENPSKTSFKSLELIASALKNHLPSRNPVASKTKKYPLHEGLSQRRLYQTILGQVKTKLGLHGCSSLYKVAIKSSKGKYYMHSNKNLRYCGYYLALYMFWGTQRKRNTYSCLQYLFADLD